MCGRYTLTKEERELRKKLGLNEPISFKPRFNIAPTQQAPVIVRAPLDASSASHETTGGFALEFMRWGLIPSWAQDEAVGNQLINARAETAAEKPSFRGAFSKRRCLVLADGFYEWTAGSAGKTPVRIVLKTRELFAFAGLWESWRPLEGGEIRSFSILTTCANPLLAQVHHRMPVILPESDWSCWLHPEAERDSLKNLLRSYPAELMEFYVVNRVVNKARHDHPECIVPAANYSEPQLGLGI